MVWRTPGADGGRDLEGIFPARDLSGYLDTQKWYIDCKRYKKSLDWPTVWEKIAFSDAASADFLLIFTNSNPSPQCESEITLWNSGNRHPKVRVWRGYDIGRILKQYPAIAVKYGLAAQSDSESAGLISLSLECVKITQAAYASYEFGNNGLSALETAAAICELLASKINDLAIYGRTVHAATDQSGIPTYSWLRFGNDLGNFNDTSLRAFVAALKYVTGSEGVLVNREEPNFNVEAIARTIPLLPASLRLLTEIAMWADWEIEVVDEEAAHLTLRRRTYE